VTYTFFFQPSFEFGAGISTSIVTAKSNDAKISKVLENLGLPFHEVDDTVTGVVISKRDVI
jgi:hypothetical protein